MSVRIIQADADEGNAQVRALLETLHAGALTADGTGGADIRSAVRDVIADVEARGDAAVIDLTAKIEKVRLTPETMRVEDGKIRAAHARAAPAFLDLVRRAVANIREYQKAILHKDPPPLKRGGRRLGVRYTPVDRAGAFIPGGGASGAALVSSMLMTIVPAQVAGVGEIAVVSPPTVDGDVGPLVLGVAAELGIEEVYRVSGTAGVAAMAIGTETIPAVDKIVGPGSAYVTEAKRQLFGRVGIDSLAGPSEVLIVADQTADPKWIAADMLAQAEHDPGSAILVTTSRKLAEEVAMQIEMQIAGLERIDALRAALEKYSLIVVTMSMNQACELANDFATEHLQIVTEDDEAVLGKIRNAGAIFLGPHTTVPLGDYYAGPSHVLPTGGTAKFFSPLSCNEFLKASSVLHYDAESLSKDADDVIDLATREGLTAHAAAIRIRSNT